MKTKTTKRELEIEIQRLELVELCQQEGNKLLKEEIEKLHHSLDRKREIVTDINQWATLLVNNRNLNQRVVFAIVGSIYNRTTD